MDESAREIPKKITENFQKNHRKLDFSLYKIKM